MTITKVIDQEAGLFEVHIPPHKNFTESIVGVAHDYVLLMGTTSISTNEKCKDRIKFGSNSTTNTLNVETTLQIPIKRMSEIILPILNEEPNLKIEHASKYGTHEKRHVMHYWGKDKNMVAVIRKNGEAIHMSQAAYRELISNED